MTYDIEKVAKPNLRKWLGNSIYNNLTEGQLAAYLDTYYQSPVSAKRIAGIHKTQGAEAAGKAMGVKGYASRNADRRRVFFNGLNGKSNLPQDVNTMVEDIASLPYNGPKSDATVPLTFTEEDQRLLDTPALAVYNPEYNNEDTPYDSELEKIIKLNDDPYKQNPA